MYKGASDGRQSALTRGRLSDWSNGDFKLTLEEQFFQNKEGIKILTSRIANSSGEKKKDLLKEMAALEAAQSELKKKHHLVKKQRQGIEQFIAEEARLILPKNQWEVIYNSAKRKYDIATKIAEQDAVASEQNEPVAIDK